MSTDEEDYLDRQLGLTDDVSRQVFYLVFRPFVVYTLYIFLRFVCVTNWSEIAYIFNLYF